MKCADALLCQRFPAINHAKQPMNQDLSDLERKLATLIAHTRALRAANEALRRDLAAAHERNGDLASRVQQAGARLDALIARMPAE